MRVLSILGPADTANCSENQLSKLRSASNVKHLEHRQVD